MILAVCLQMPACGASSILNDTMYTCLLQAGSAYPTNAMYFVGLVTGAIQAQAVVNPANLVGVRSYLPLPLPRSCHHSHTLPLGWLARSQGVLS